MENSDYNFYRELAGIEDREISIEEIVSSVISELAVTQELREDIRYKLTNKLYELNHIDKNTVRRALTRTMYHLDAEHKQKLRNHVPGTSTSYASGAKGSAIKNSVSRLIDTMSEEELITLLNSLRAKRKLIPESADVYFSVFVSIDQGNRWGHDSDCDTLEDAIEQRDSIKNSEPEVRVVVLRVPKSEARWNEGEQYISNYVLKHIKNSNTSVKSESVDDSVMWLYIQKEGDVEWTRITGSDYQEDLTIIGEEFKNINPTTKYEILKEQLDLEVDEYEDNTNDIFRSTGEVSSSEPKESVIPGTDPDIKMIISKLEEVVKQVEQNIKNLNHIFNEYRPGEFWDKFVSTVKMLISLLEDKNIQGAIQLVNRMSNIETSYLPDKLWDIIEIVPMSKQSKHLRSYMNGGNS